jgi:hypothetical protein
MHPDANPVVVCVRCVRDTASSSAKDQESAAARAAGEACRQPIGRGSRGGASRAARLHPDAGGRGARRQPLNVRPARASAPRDGRDAVGHAPRARRRARAAPRRTATTGSQAHPTADARPARSLGARDRRQNPGRACQRQDPRRYRKAPQRRRNANGSRRQTVVAINGTGRSRPPSSAHVRSTGEGRRWARAPARRNHRAHPELFSLRTDRIVVAREIVTAEFVSLTTSATSSGTRRLLWAFQVTAA